MTIRRHVHDPAVVDAILAGYPVEWVTIEDREEVVRRLNAGGMSDPDIAAATGWTKRTIQRIRKRREIPAAVTLAGTPVEPPLQPYVAPVAGAIQHHGRFKMVDRTDRSDGSDSFIDAFFSDPFNQLVAKTKPPCGDRWDIFSPPEKSDHFDYTSYEHRVAESLRKREADAICATCPIQAECLDYSLRPGPLGGQPDEFGIWASTTEEDRIKIHKKRRRAAAQQLRATSMPSSSN